MLTAHVLEQTLRACKPVIEQGAGIDGTAAVVALVASLLMVAMITDARPTTVPVLGLPPAMGKDVAPATVLALILMFAV